MAAVSQLLASAEESHPLSNLFFVFSTKRWSSQTLRYQIFFFICMSPFAEGKNVTGNTVWCVDTFTRSTSACSLLCASGWGQCKGMKGIKGEKQKKWKEKQRAEEDKETKKETKRKESINRLRDQKIDMRGNKLFFHNSIYILKWRSIDSALNYLQDAAFPSAFCSLSVGTQLKYQSPSFQIVYTNIFCDSRTYIFSSLPYFSTALG